MRRAHIIALVAFVALAVTGCAVPTPGNIVNRAVNKTVDSAANKVGEQVGQAIAADILANNPHLINAYAMGMFNLMFYNGGYYLETGGYDVGEWSTWNSSGVQEADWFQRALLKEHSNGNQWWRVETHSTDESTGEEQVVLMEALFSAPDSSGGRRVLRMRSQLPGETEPREVPITEDDSRSWYFGNTRRLTEESMQGMTVGEEEVEVPAGKFVAKHLQTKGSDGSSHDWWLNEAVPGGLVKFTREKPDSEELYYEVKLLSFGTDANESKLGIDLSEKAAATEDGAESSTDDDEPGEEQNEDPDQAKTEQ